jgi:hypothetical protein
MRQRTATDIQTKSKRKRFSKQKSLLEPTQEEFLCREWSKPTKIRPEILVAGNSAIHLPKEKPIFVRTRACYEAHGG